MFPLPTSSTCAPYVAELNQRLSATRLYYASDFSSWTVGKNQIPAAQHAKIYIIDDTHFYVGSDNFYTSGNVKGLQEYGHLVEGQAETQGFISDYWSKLWENSSKHCTQAKTPNFTTPVVLPPNVGV